MESRGRGEIDRPTEKRFDLRSGCREEVEDLILTFQKERSRMLIRLTRNFEGTEHFQTLLLCGQIPNEIVVGIVQIGNGEIASGESCNNGLRRLFPGKRFVACLQTDGQSIGQISRRGTPSVFGRRFLLRNGDLENELRRKRRPGKRLDLRINFDGEAVLQGIPFVFEEAVNVQRIDADRLDVKLPENDRQDAFERNQCESKA